MQGGPARNVIRGSQYPGPLAVIVVEKDAEVERMRAALEGIKDAEACEAWKIADVALDHPGRP